MEADLAFRGIDAREFWLPGGGPSRLSLRRMLLLIRGLPYDAAFRRELNAAERASQAHQLTGRRDHYAAIRARQEQEAARDR